MSRKLSIGNIAVYGVDVKITPEGRPYIIEINGVDSGTDFFKYHEGFAYYRRFMKDLGEAVNGKPIYLETSGSNRKKIISTSEPDNFERAWHFFMRRTKNGAKLIEQYHRERDEAAKFVNSLIPEFWFPPDWLRDELSFNLSNLDKVSDEEENYYFAAGRELKLPVFLFDDAESEDDNFIFTYKKKKTKVNKGSIGVIWAHSGTLEDLAEDKSNSEFVLNSAFSEFVTDYKVHSKCVLNENLNGKIMPKSVAFGLGVGHPADVLRFIGSLDCEYIVHKPNGSQCGVGVQIYEMENFKQAWSLLPFYLTTTEKDKRISLERILEFAKKRYVEKYISLIEEFVPSKLLVHPRELTLHDGCARIIVLRKGLNELPQVINGQWRLCPEPIGKDRLEQRFRANLSRGALAVPMSERDLYSVRHFVQDAIINFENRTNNVFNLFYKGDILETRNEFRWSFLENIVAFHLPFAKDEVLDKVFNKDKVELIIT